MFYKSMIKQTKFLLNSLASFIVLVGPATLIADELNWKPYNLEVVTQHIIPAYQQLEESAASLNDSSKILCNNSTDKNLSLVRENFIATMNAWQLIQHVSFGPIEYDMRSHNMQFWPDKKNHIGKQLNKLLIAADLKLLEPEKFTTASVAIKGLPAIERIIYSTVPLIEIDKEPFRCNILVAVTENVSQIASSLHKEWKESMLPQFKDSQQVDGYFEDDIDAATALLKTLVEPLEIIVDLKLKRPLGSEFGKQKYKRLESWRSERSLQNIKQNILSTRAMLFGANGDTALSLYLEQDTQKLLLAQLEAVESDIKNLRSSLENAINNEAGNEQVRQLMSSISTLHKSLEQAISSLGIHLGFNSRDGD